MFDYIIIGAGSAGCVLANRLTADGVTRVLLLEAGRTSKNIWMKIPAGTARLYADAKVNWRYYTVEEPALHNRRIYCPRGKTIGGSSSINGLVYMRGAPADYDQWERLLLAENDLADAPPIPPEGMRRETMYEDRH